MKKYLAVAAMAAAVAAALPAAHAAEGDTILRLRAIQVDPDVSTDIPGLDVEKEDITGEIAVTGFFSQHWALELGASYSEHDIMWFGGNIGEAQIIPVNLLLQFHFTREGPIRPYIGAGGNYTRFEKVTAFGSEANVEKDSFGPVAQVGIDIPLGENLVINVDAKKIWMKTEFSGVPNGEVELDPWVYGAGIGFKF
jgi:outer membrane protein